MSKKKKQVKKPREMTRRQLSRWQKQARRERLIRYTGIFIVIAVILVVAAGIFLTQYKPLFDTAIVVNGTKFNTQYYIDMLKYFQAAQANMNQQFLISLMDRTIKENEMVRQAALELGITVSDEEIQQEIEDRDPPHNNPKIVMAELLIQKLLDEYFDKQVPLSAEQRHIQAMFLESEEQALEITGRLNAGEDFATVAAEFSLDRTTRDESGDIGWHPQGIVSYMLDSQVADDYAFNAGAGVLSPPVADEEKGKDIAYWLIKILERKEDSESVDIAVIQLGSQAEAEQALARIEAGEDFGDVAADMSHLEEAEEDRGKVGEVPPGMLDKAMDEFIFDPEVEVGTVSPVIRNETSMTFGGYWLIKVLEVENDREITEEDRDILKNMALEEWVQALWDNPDNEIETLLTGDKLEWAVAKASEQ